MQVRVLFLVFLALLAAFPAYAGKADPNHKYVQTRLVTEMPAITPGQPFWIAFEQAIEKDWHTYWKNPGDSGLSTTLVWTLPDGFKADPMLWPTPTRVPSGPLLNFGYSDRAIFLTKITPPADIAAPSVDLKVKAEWLACKEICIPEAETLTIALPIAREITPLEPDASGYFAMARRLTPQPVDWPATYHVAGDNFVLSLHVPEDPVNSITGAHALFPEEWGLFKYPADQDTKMEDGRIVVSVPKSERKLHEVPKATFVLTLTDSTGASGRAVSFVAQHAPVAGPVTEPARVTPVVQKPTDNAAPMTLWLALGLAVLGGLVLNLMPCVFPVLSLKALSLAGHVEKERAQIRLSGLAYTAGVLVTFGAIAGLMIALVAAGAQIGWGFQLQNPIVTTLLAVLLFAIGLNLSGLFELRSVSFAANFTQDTGVLSSFLTGVLATLVATPCTAPFMGAAMGYALVQPAGVALAVFLALGFGLALPYLLLCLIPAMQKLLPKPGAWMEATRNFLAFPMYASAIWLVWVLALQSGPHGVMVALALMLGFAFAVWSFRHGMVMRSLGLAVFLATLALIPGVRTLGAVNTASQPGHVAIVPFTQQALDVALKGNQPVFVNMTAAWCITCKINERVAIHTDEVQALFREKNITYIVGDWTNRNPEITHLLNVHGRNGVPLYLYYAPRLGGAADRPEPVVLPQILTPSIFLETLNPNSNSGEN